MVVVVVVVLVLVLVLVVVVVVVVVVIVTDVRFFYMLNSFFWVVVEWIPVGQKSGLCWNPPSGPKSPLKTNCG